MDKLGLQPLFLFADRHISDAERYLHSSYLLNRVVDQSAAAPGVSWSVLAHEFTLQHTAWQWPTIQTRLWEWPETKTGCLDAVTSTTAIVSPTPGHLAANCNRSGQPIGHFYVPAYADPLLLRIRPARGGRYVLIVGAERHGQRKRLEPAVALLAGAAARIGLDVVVKCHPLDDRRMVHRLASIRNVQVITTRVPRSQYYDLLRRAACLVVASTRESICLPVLEAAAMARPVIRIDGLLARIGMGDRLWSDHYVRVAAGGLDPVDENELADVLEQVKADTSRLGLAARRRVARAFPFAYTVEAIRSVLAWANPKRFAGLLSQHTGHLTPGSTGLLGFTRTSLKPHGCGGRA